MRLQFRSMLGALLLAAGCIDGGGAAPTSCDGPCAEADQLGSIGPRGVLAAWQSCADPADPQSANDQCTTLRVPLDYLRPHGEQVALAVVRRPATDPAHRIGVLSYVYGGPGEPLIADGPLSVTDAVAERFDRVGFDPRGIENSTRPRCYSDAVVARARVVDQWPADPAAAAVAGSLVHDVQQGCVANGPRNLALLAHMNTHDHASDLEALRAALEAEDRALHASDGQQMADYRLNLYGSSYGTELVATYMTLYPAHVRSAVLDSPSAVYLRSWTDYSYEQLQGFELALQRFFAWCSSPGNGCAFGAGRPTRQAVADAFDALTRALDQRKAMGAPIQYHAPDRVVTIDSTKVAATVPTEPGFDVATRHNDYANWIAWGDALHKVELSVSGASGGDAGQALIDNFLWIGGIDPDDESYTIAYPAFKANDKPMVHHDGTPYTYAQYFELRRHQLRVAAPRTAMAGDFDLIGVQWPTRSPWAPLAIDARGAPPALLISSAYEAPCPTGWADSVRALLGNGSYLLRHDADGHVLGKKLACTRAEMERYYLALTPPGTCVGLSPEIPWDLSIVPPRLLARDQSL